MDDGRVCVASLSLVGIPPASRVRLQVVSGPRLVERGSPWLLGVLLVSSLLNAAYLGPIVYKAYFEEAPDVAATTRFAKCPGWSSLW